MKFLTIIDPTLIFYKRRQSSTKLRIVLTIVGTNIAMILFETVSGTIKVNGKRISSY